MESKPVIPGRDTLLVAEGRATAAAIRAEKPDGPWSREDLLTVFDQLKPTGYLGSTIDRQHGGSGLALGQFASLLEGLATEVPFLSNHSVQRFIVGAGSPEVRELVLPGLLDGTRIGSVAITEPHGGSSIREMRTTVVPDGAELVLNGSKDWVTHAMTADTAAVLCSDEQENPVRVIVDLYAPGVTRIPLHAHGLRHLTFGSLQFDDVRIQRWRVLEEDGVAGAKAGLGIARTLVAVQAVALGFRALVDATEHLATRTVRGSRVIDLDLTSGRVGALAAELQGARLLAYHAIEAVEAGQEAAAAMASGAKAHACAVAVRACSELVSTCAGHGLDRTSRLGDYRDDAEMLGTADGTGLVNHIIWGSYLKKHLGECF
ncbi:acyl-CoA dehydrogenase [Saccharopolyspora sp. NPDC049426]|uniref:acyl-CoA dehydrogenase family protein n=1 Tax=Saccharopolyspora sp. NPDC049426 TaxID=3155652 RepID=UPI0034177E92